MKDKPLAAGILGGLSTISYELATKLLLFLGVGKYSAYQLTSLIITLNRPEEILGGILSWVVGASIAVVLYYTLLKIGIEHLIIKCLALSLLGWVLMETIYTLLIEGPKLIQNRPISDYYLQMIGSVIYGLTLGILFAVYLFKNLKRNQNK